MLSIPKILASLCLQPLCLQKTCIYENAYTSCTIYLFVTIQRLKVRATGVFAGRREGRQAVLSLIIRMRLAFNSQVSGAGLGMCYCRHTRFLFYTSEFHAPSSTEGVQFEALIDTPLYICINVDTGEHPECSSFTPCYVFSIQVRH